MLSTTQLQCYPDDRHANHIVIFSRGSLRDREIPSQRTHCVDIARYTLDNCNKERRNRPYVFKLKPDAAAGSSTQKYDKRRRARGKLCCNALQVRPFS